MSPETEQINFSLACCYLFLWMQSSVCVRWWVINPNITILNLDAPDFSFFFNCKEFCSHRNNIKDKAQWFSLTAPSVYKTLSSHDQLHSYTTLSISKTYSSEVLSVCFLCGLIFSCLWHALFACAHSRTLVRAVVLRGAAT